MLGSFVALRNDLMTLGRRPFAAPHPQLIVDVERAEHVVGDVFGAVLGPPVGHGAAQHHVRLLHLDLDLAGVDLRVRHQAIAELLADAVVAAPVVLRPAAGVRTALAVLEVSAMPGSVAIGVGPAQTGEVASAGAAAPWMRHVAEAILVALALAQLGPLAAAPVAELAGDLSTRRALLEGLRPLPCRLATGAFAGTAPAALYGASPLAAAVTRTLFAAAFRLRFFDCVTARSTAHRGLSVSCHGCLLFAPACPEGRGHHVSCRQRRRSPLAIHSRNNAARRCAGRRGRSVASHHAGQRAHAAARRGDMSASPTAPTRSRRPCRGRASPRPWDRAPRASPPRRDRRSSPARPSRARSRATGSRPAPRWWSASCGSAACRAART